MLNPANERKSAAQTLQLRSDRNCSVIILSDRDMGIIKMLDVGLWMVLIGGRLFVWLVLVCQIKRLSCPIDYLLSAAKP